MFVGNELKKIRKEKKLTQNELSKILGISPDVLFNYENNLEEAVGEDLEKLQNFINDEDYSFKNTVSRTKAGLSKKINIIGSVIVTILIIFFIYNMVSFGSFSTSILLFFAIFIINIILHFLKKKS